MLFEVMNVNILLKW